MHQEGVKNHVAPQPVADVYQQAGSPFVGVPGILQGKDAHPKAAAPSEIFMEETSFQAMAVHLACGAVAFCFLRPAAHRLWVRLGFCRAKMRA